MALTLDDLTDSARDPERPVSEVFANEAVISVLVLLAPKLGASIVAHEQDNQ